MSLLELLNFSLSKKHIRQPQGGICQNDSTSEAQSMNSNYLRYIWAFYRQRPLSGWVLRNIMCLYRLLLFPLCILITLAIFFPPQIAMNRISITLIHECAMLIPASVSLAYRLWGGGWELLEGRLMCVLGMVQGPAAARGLRRGCSLPRHIWQEIWNGWGAQLPDDVVDTAGTPPCRSVWGWVQAAEQGGFPWVPTPGTCVPALVGE